MLGRFLKHFFTTAFYINRTVFYIAGSAVVLYVLSYFAPALFAVANFILLLLLISVLVDTLLLFAKRKALQAERITADRWSNGDDNKVVIGLKNNYNFPVTANVIDELPVQFQERHWLRRLPLTGNGEGQITYHVKPVTRGEYEYGNINVFVNGPLQLAKRRFVFPLAQTVKVYPSYVQMRRFQLLAVSNRLQEAGVKRVRRIGHSMEFEQIKEYVRGDDYRTINWKATARRSDLMVNTFTDERSQQVYCVINKGRAMKMPFEGMTLLDYAVNASLVLSNVALAKQDKAGIITFAENLDAFLLAPVIQIIFIPPYFAHILWYQ